MQRRNAPVFFATAVAVIVALQGVIRAQTPVEPTRKVLVIGIDGLRPDALGKAKAPHLHALRDHGAYSPNAQGESHTFSGPNWASIMTGVHTDRHHVTTNSYTNNHLDDWPDFFTYLEKHNPQWVTARLLTWDSFYENHPTGADVDLFHPMSRGGDEDVTRDAAALLTGADPRAPGGVDAMFIYYGDVDATGHGHGFGPKSPEYLGAIAAVDQQVGRLLDAIASRPTYEQEQWLYIVTSDHGGSLDGQHSGNTADRRHIPFIVSGPGVAKGPVFPNACNVDVATTVLTYMGVPIDPAWRLDGHAVGLEPSAPPKAAYGENLIFNGDAEYDRGVPQTPSPKWFDRYCSGWHDDGPEMVNILTYDRGEQPMAGWLSPVQGEAIGGGRNFFAGGYAPLSRITQTIDLSPLAHDIDAQQVDYTLSAALGGWKDDGDFSMFIARYHDVSGHVIGTVVIGPVTAADREGRSQLLPRQACGTVPSGARNVTVELLCIRLKGDANGAYADNLSLVLSPRRPDDTKQ